MLSQQEILRSRAQQVQVKHRMYLYSYRQLQFIGVRTYHLFNYKGSQVLLVKLLSQAESLYVPGIKLDLLSRTVPVGRPSYLISLFFLAGLGSKYLSTAEIMDLLHLFSEQGGVSYSRAISRADQLKTQSRFKPIQGEEGRDSYCLRHLAIIGKFSRGQLVNLVILQVGHIGSQVLFKDSVHPFGLSIRFRVLGS